MKSFSGDDMKQVYCTIWDMQIVWNTHLLSRYYVPCFQVWKTCSTGYLNCWTSRWKVGQSANRARFVSGFPVLACPANSLPYFYVISRDLLKLAKRLSHQTGDHTQLSIFHETVDCLAAYLRRDRLQLVTRLASCISIAKEKVLQGLVVHQRTFVTIGFRLSTLKCATNRAQGLPTTSFPWVE